MLGLTEEEKRRKMTCNKNHFVLVHGAGHGAWCWYKVTAILRAAGHRVTVPDLAACGVNPKQAGEVKTLSDYSQPLLEIMASLPTREKVILVGHSYGGLSMALAMECFPEKISAAVFVAAIMPNPSFPMIYFANEFLKWNPSESKLDTGISFNMGHENHPTSLRSGPGFLLSKLYQLCSPEDFTLATMVVRDMPSINDDLSRESIISEEKFGSVSRVFIICKEDKLYPETFQRWLIETTATNEVKEIEGSDHMAMLSKPQELCLQLLEIAKTYP